MFRVSLGFLLNVYGLLMAFFEVFVICLELSVRRAGTRIPESTQKDPNFLPCCVLRFRQESFEDTLWTLQVIFSIIIVRSKRNAIQVPMAINRRRCLMRCLGFVRSPPPCRISREDLRPLAAGKVDEVHPATELLVRRRSGAEDLPTCHRSRS